MTTPRLLSIIAFGAAICAASEAMHPFTTVVLSDTADTTHLAVSWHAVEVRDLRKLGLKDSHLLGTWSPIPFEERTGIRTQGTVASEVKSLVQRWVPGDSGIPIRIDLLAFETWSEPVPGPDPIHALVQVRVVSLDEKHPGLLIEPKAQAEKKLGTRVGDQTEMLTSLLHDVLVLVKSPYRPSPDTGATASEPNKWADPEATPAPVPGVRALRQILSGFAVAGVGGVGAGLRYDQYVEPPSSTWTPEYWGGLQLRGPWNGDEFSQVWSGELEGGLAWHRRLDAGASAFVFVASAGGILGVEGSRPVHDDGTVGDRKTFVFVGAEGRAALRWQPLNTLGLSWSAGPQITLRAPVRLAWFDPALFAEVGWRM